MPNPKYYQITLPSGSTQIWDEDKVNRNKKWLDDKKAKSEEVNQFEVTLPSGASQTWDADKYGRNIEWLNEHKAQVRGSLMQDQTADVKPAEPETPVTPPADTISTPPPAVKKQPAKEEKPAPSFGLNYDPEHPWRIQKPGYETSPMPEEYRNKPAAEEDPLEKGFDDEPQGPTWDQRQREGNRKQVAQLSGRIDTMLNDAVSESMQLYKKQQEAMSKQGNWFERLIRFVGENSGRAGDPGARMMRDNYLEYHGAGDRELSSNISALHAAKKSMTTAERMIAEADHNAQSGTFGKWLEQSFIGGAARGFGQKLFDVSTWDMGMSDLENAGAFMDALNAFDNGQELTEAQQLMLDAKAVELATNAYFGSYVGRGYKAGSVTAESIPFMLEMCINPASSIGEAATSKMARYAISRFGKQAAKSAAHKAARAVGRAGADLAGAAIMSATTGAVGVAADAMERMNGEVTYDEDVTAPGVSAFADHTPGEAPAVAIAKAFGSRTIENYSEMVGEYFAPVLGAAGHGVQKGLEKIGLGKVSQFIDDVAASDVGRLVSDFEHNAKWNGVFGEYAEEVVGSIMNALTVGDQTLDAAEGTGVFNLDQNIDTFLGVALMGGFMSGIKTAGYRTPKYRTRKGLERADNAAGAAFDGTDWWEDIRNGIQANPDAALHDVLTSDALNPQQRRAAIEYAKAYQEYDGVLKAEAKRRTDEAADPRMNDLETSFDNGYELASEQEMNDARNMYQAQKARLQQTIGVDDIDETQALQQDDLPYSEEEKQTIMDYLNAKATYDGMIQRVRDDIDSRIEAANTQIDLNTNATTGRIHSAVTSDDRKVYIVGGNVKLYEDGTIDRETSDKDIIIRDQETGQKEFWDIGMLKSIEAPIDPVDEKNIAAATVREQVARQAADKMDGRLHFQMGDVYTLTTPDGSSFPVQITANEQGIIDNGDGTVNVILNGATVDGQPVISQMPKEQIQQMSDATNLGRLAAYQQQKAAEEAAKPSYVLDDVLTLDVNGTPIRGSITADADADGRYEVYTEAPIDGKKVNLFTREQLDAMVSEKNGEAVTRTEMPVSGTENATSGTVSPENSTVQPENGTQAAPSDGTALSRIPVDENNVPQFEQAPLNDGWAALMELNDGNEQDTVEMANDMVVNAEAELQKAQKQKPKGTNPLEIKASRDEIRKAVAAAQNKVNFWKQIAGYPETLRNEMEAEARRQKRARLAEARKIQREQGRFGKEDRVLGDALSFEEYVMRTIANGAIRFKWGNDPNNAAIKGLGSHLGFTDNPTERNQRIWMLSNAEGLYPEAAAEELLQGYAEHLGVDEVPGMDTMDAFSTLLDVLLSYGSSRAMFDAAKELHQKNDPNFLETKQAEMAAAMAEDEAKNAQQQFNREVPETPEKARGVIAAVVELAKTVKDRVERAIIAALTPRQKQDFAEKGIDVTDNFVHSIENSAILHNQKEHGNPAVEEKRGQIAIEESDYALIPEILEDYDTVEKSPNKNKQGRDVIIYTKMYPDGTVYYLEEVRENRESLAFQTMYKKKSGSGSSDGLMQQDAASPSTPVAPSDNSVSVSDNKGSEISGENNTSAENPTVEAIQAAREEVNTEPTDAQKEAGNYKKGHVKIDGYDISIENPKGSVRRGTSPDGTQWETQMNNDYGYIRSTEGVDGDHIDVYLSDNPSEGNVYVIDQVDPSTGEFDEHKVMYGFPDEESARAAYLANYEDGWQGLGTITGVSKDEFKKWVDSSHRKTKPFAGYKSVKPVQSDIKSVADEDAEKQEYVRAVLALDDSVNTGDVFTNDNGGTIRIIEKKPKHQGYMVEINTPAFAGTVENTPAELYRRVNEEGYRKQERTPEPPTTPKGPKRVNVESLLGALSQNGEAKLSDHVEEETPETVTDSVTIEPAQYTRKDGKTIEMFRVNPGRELSHEEWSAVSKFLKEKRGWKDRENGGFMVRSEEDARALADLVRDDKAMNEARPVSLTDMQQLGSVSIDTSEVEAPKEDQKEPVWKYELTSVEGGRTYLSRSQVMPDGTEIYDGHFDVRADNPEEMKGILQNNGLYDTLSDFDKQMLERKIEHWQFRQRVQNEGINGLHLGDKVMYKGKEATVHDFEEYEDNRPVLDTGLAPVIYEIAESWDAVQKVEAPAATPVAEEQPGETQPERPVNPSGNKLVTDERYAELRLKMMQKLKGQMNMGIDPEILAIGTEMAVYHIEKGARKFVEYAKAMIADLSDAIRPYLKAFYNGARDLPEMQESGLAAEMDSYADVQAVDVANFDKDRANVLDTVAAIEKEAEVAEQAQQGAEKLQKVRNTVASDVPASELEARRTFSRSVATEMIEAVSTGKRPFDSIVDLRKLAEKCGMTLDKLGSSDILLQELVEDGLVTAARDIIESKRYGGIKSREAYDAIVQLYEMQPSINQRSSNRIKMQQYSTPLPMAFVADMFAFHPGRTGSVLEPTAGNGMLVFAIPAERVHANELDETRLANLREQGFREVTSQDGALPFEGEYDAVIANPPFGSAEAKEYDGVSISGLDPQIALNALASMSDTGKAAIIVGGNLEYAANGSIKGGKKAFFSYLYDHYNVKGIVDMSGDLYKRQGTKFPTMMILIDGRRSEEERAQTKVYPPVKSAAIAKVNNFDELYDTIVSVLQSKQKTNGYETVRAQEMGLFDNHRPSGESGMARPAVEHHANASDGRDGGESGSVSRGSVGRDGQDGNIRVQGPPKQGRGDTSGLGHAEVSGPEGRPDGREAIPDSGSSDSGRRNADVREGGERISDDGTGRNDVGSIPASGTPGSGVGLTHSQTQPRKAKPQQPKEERKLTDEKLHYVQHSSAFSLESVAPAAMVEAMDATLGKIETKYGMSIDDFVTDELGYDSVEAMHNALAAEQVDSVAMAIDQMKQGQALVIGDQTGVGKGRQMAALIRWGVRQGKQPIFFTKTADLFTDIYRDLVDIGSGDLNPFIINARDGKNPGVMLDANGKIVHQALPAKEQLKIFESGELPPEYDFVILTYTQVNTGDAASAEEAYNEKKKNGARAGKPKNIRPNPKADFLRKIAKDNYLFLDESHNAAGESKSGYYLQSLVKDAAAVTFASATFAKRPDTMPLYALRTAMSKAQLGEGKSLIGIIKRGGVTLQEIMSRALTAAGQMVRRERDMSDVQTDWETVTDPETVRKARENYDKTIEAFNDIINFQTRYVTPMIDALSGAMALTGSSAKHKQGTKEMGIKNTSFASKTYNYTKQLMLALKANAIVDRVAKEIQEGRHPVIALESTMETLLKDYAPGEVIDNPTFAASLLRGLDTVMQYTVTDENGKETHRTYSPAELGEEGERAYYELRDKITEATSGIFISPLDAIIEGLQAKGFRVGEFTGRSLCTGTDTKGRTVVRKRTDTDKLKLQMDFNSGALDVLILNKSASTGISLHASKKFKDQRQRSMIIAQPLSDINDYMQMIGRIDRTGQVSRGYYINLALPVPAEQRFNMMLSTKLKSLNANTTTSQDNESSSVEAPDLLNKYGSQVVVEYLRDNPDIYRKMGSPLKNAKGKVTAAELDEYKAGEEDARMITGYVALLSTKEQQDFYDDVIRRYNDLINYLNETGTNDLRITVMPLQAKTIQKTVSSEGTEPDGDNPFAQNAFVEKVEMNVLSKPMSADEIRKAIKKLNGDKSGSDRRKEILKQLHDEAEAKLKSEDERYETAKAKAEEDIAKRTALVMAKDKMTDEEKQAAIEKFSASIREKAENAHEDNKKKYIASANALYHRMMYFDVGSTYLIADNLGTGGQSLFSSPAIFCGFKVKESKITASTTIAVFAPLDGRRRIEVKLSDMTSCNQIKDLTDLNYDVAQQTKLENWDAQIPNETRKEGYILTGNILQAIADTSDEMGNYTGQLVSFTDDEGNVRDGILMPDQWTPALLPSAGVPINARAAEIEQGRSFTSTDGNVSIQTGYFRSAGQPMYYYLSVPKSKAKGGKFFLNDELLSLLHGGEFTTRSGKMQATIWPDNLKPVLNFLAQMGVRVADTTAKGTGEETRRFRDGEQIFSDNFKKWFGDWENTPNSASKVVDNEGKPLVVEHATNNDFTEFDINRLGENSHDKGLFGAGFYFGTHAPGWMQGSKKVMRVFLDIKNPFEIPDTVSGKRSDFYRFLVEKFDIPALRSLKLTQYGRSINFGDYLDIIKAVNAEIAQGLHDENLAKDEEIQATYRPEDRMEVYRDRLISERAGHFGTPANSMGFLIGEVIGSEEFTKALKEAGYDGVIVNRGSDYNEYVAFYPEQIKSATDNNGRFDTENPDFRFREPATPGSTYSDDIRASVTDLASRLGEKVRIIEDVNELKHTNPNVQRRMRNALGWYETESGEVVVVLPNARSVADARATIFHETVAHKGLRELVGKDRFDDFLERVYAGATKKTREAINALAKRHGWDLAEGTEEYIARLAESGFDERENASFWEKVRRFFEDMISEAKLRLGFRITDNDLRYALWRSYQMRRSKGALGVAEDVDMQQRLGVGNFRDGSRRFRDPDEVLHDRTLARDHYEKAVSSGLYQFREAVQDSMLGLRTLMQSILQAEGKGKVNIEDVDAFENAYLAENAMSSMNKAEQEAYYKLVMSPLLKAVSDLGVPQQEVTEYMMAKHGLERNRLMAERAATAAEEADEEHRRTHDEWLEHFRKNDYAGLIGLTGKKTVRDAEREALRMVNEFEADHDTTDLWAKTNAATKASLQKLYESGLLTKAGFDHISDMYEYYIPLRGWDETTSDELYGYLSERRGVLNSPLKKAEGRRSKADDPLAYIASMADTAIMQGNRNRMKQRFLNFVLNHPSDLVSVNDIWLSYDDTTDEWKPVFADLQPTDTAEEVEQKVADFEAKMQALSESDPDHYKSGKDAKNIPFKVVHNNLKEHQVLVKRGGKTYVLTINGNPRAAQALNGLTNPDTDISGFVGSLIKGGQWVNRHLSAVYTTRNVEFIASNFMRDMLYSNCMTWVKESPSYALRFHKNFGRMNPGHMLALFTKWENGTLDESDQTEKMFKQFMMNGGETGYTTVKDIEKQKKEIAAQIKKFGKTMPVTKAWEFLGTSFDVLNRAVENAARFAAFVTSREMGRTLERSVYDAKEVSVNFNKKGAGDKFAGAVGQTLLGQIGSYGSAAGRLLYVFWNAGVQGLTNFGRAAKRHPGKAAAGMASMFALGMAIAALAASGGDGDDDDANAYYNLPEYVRRSNICFRAGNSWITIPLPIEFRGIYGMGELAMGTITGKEHYSDNELAFQIGSQVSQVLPLDMLEGGGLADRNGRTAGQALLQTFMPSGLKPLHEASINRSWTGLPIYKDTYFNKDLPNWTKAYKSANKQLVELAETANRMSGGDEFTKGAVDINPARVEYMLNGYFGGYSTLVNKLVKMAETATGQRDFEWRNMLVASRLVKSGDERTQRRKLTNDFFNIKDEAEQTQRRLRGYEDKADAGLADYAEKLDFLMNSPEYLRFEIYDEYSADLKDIREDMKEETDPEQYKVLEDEYYALMREMVDKVNESRESKR